MGNRTQKGVSGKTVRIWTDRKERLQKLIEKKQKVERRPISEAEMVSRAVDLLCDGEELKLKVK